MSEHPDVATSPLCPIHFPGATYLGELVPDVYLGQLTQEAVVDHEGVRLRGVAGRYALFSEDGGCGQLLALLPGIPSPYPLTDDQLGALEAALDGDDGAALPADLATLLDDELAWLELARSWKLRLDPDRGHALVTACVAAGRNPDADHVLAALMPWLYDRAGRLCHPPVDAPAQT